MWNLLFAEMDRFERVLVSFKYVISAVGAGIILLGLVLFFYQPKDESKRSSLAARLTGGVSFVLMGTGTIIYAWYWLGKT